MWLKKNHDRHQNPAHPSGLKIMLCYKTKFIHGPGYWRQEYGGRTGSAEKTSNNEMGQLRREDVCPAVWAGWVGLPKPLESTAFHQRPLMLTYITICFPLRILIFGLVPFMLIVFFEKSVIPLTKIACPLH